MKKAHGKFEAGLGRVAPALASMSARELKQLAAIVNEPLQIVPGLLQWVKDAVSWELDRRAGRHYLLRRPMRAITALEADASRLALAAMVESIAVQGDHAAITQFLHATRDLIPGGVGTH